MSSGVMPKPGFHSTKEGFKVLHCDSVCLLLSTVSIPPRKVSRELITLKTLQRISCFHSTKEGFKVLSAPRGKFNSRSFHSTKEGFKGFMLVADSLLKRFPFHQGRFQGTADPCQLPSLCEVSIPPRKVSRHKSHPQARISPCAFPFHQGRFQGKTFYKSILLLVSFHSTKEGFKVSAS